MLRPACAYAQSDQSLCKSLEHSMTIKQLVEQHLEFLGLKLAAQGCLSLHLSKCHIVGNHMSRLIYLRKVLKNLFLIAVAVILLARCIKPNEALTIKQHLLNH